jgi:hypothetical protein
MLTGVLHADEGAEHTQNARGDAQIEANAVGVTGPAASPGADDHVVAAEILHDLLKQGEDRGTPAVDKALAADLEDVRLGQDLNGRLASGLLKHPGIAQ